MGWLVCGCGLGGGGGLAAVVGWIDWSSSDARGRRGFLLYICQSATSEISGSQPHLLVRLPAQNICMCCSSQSLSHIGWVG